ncbi:hypothetical protein ABG067_007412 [Albugo candida]|uniref:Uncharacterized protein n=1 Tax=Albugo candida TaxID=65357 RepID=A0A024FTY1_9STRA|nr:unnamed protein product [Albugo candida]|eukprot:CCI10575.1 unnamed protein product [Albugo candida]
MLLRCTLCKYNASYSTLDGSFLRAKYSFKHILITYEENCSAFEVLKQKWLAVDKGLKKMRLGKCFIKPKNLKGRSNALSRISFASLKGLILALSYVCHQFRKIRYT